MCLRPSFWIWERLLKMKVKQYRYDNGDFDLAELPTTPDQNAGVEGAIKKQLAKNSKQLKELQKKLVANRKQGLVLILQGMDAAGKDSLVAHVFAGVNPAGFQVASFKQPSSEELAHDFLWRINQKLPERGMIGIFNRSYYEDVLISRVHPQILLNENLPGVDTLDDVDDEFFNHRYSDIKHYEEYLNHCGYQVIKFFLHLSKAEQKRRFAARIERPEKNWKFSAADIHERRYWDSYQEAYQVALSKTATKKNPWYIIPGDDKGFERLVASNILLERLKQMNLAFPKMSADASAELVKAMAELNQEKD